MWELDALRCGALPCEALAFWSPSRSGAIGWFLFGAKRRVGRVRWAEEGEEVGRALRDGGMDGWLRVRGEGGGWGIGMRWGRLVEWMGWMDGWVEARGVKGRGGIGTTYPYVECMGKVGRCGTWVFAIRTCIYEAQQGMDRR